MVIDPTTFPGWNDLLLGRPDASFFHTAEWARVLSESYQYHPYYVVEIQNSKLNTLLPIMEVKSVFTGKRGVSLPFTDFCFPITDSRLAFNDVFHEAVRFGKQQGWKCIELRGGQEILSDTVSDASFNLQLTTFDINPETVFSKLRNTTRRHIQKARKSGFKIIFSHSLQSLKEFYHLNCVARKDHGLPPQPYRFFKKLYEHVLSRNLGLIVSARYRKQTVSSNIYLIYNGHAIYKYGANNRHYFHLCPSYLVMWEAMRHLISEGITTLNFGRTEKDNHGLLQFKRGWGAAEKTLNYYKYDMAQQAFVSGNGGFRTSYPLAKLTPLPLLKLAGRLLYRHVG